MVKPSQTVEDHLPDPITTEVVGSSLLAAAEEMGEILVRASYSTNVKERRDCSAAILDVGGGTIAQASHMPMHLGSMLGLVQAILQRYPASEIRPGDIFVTNDPYSGGGTHLPDITVAAPFFAWGRLVAFAANVAHHSEVGGSPSQTLDIYTEGIRIPLVRLHQEGKVCQEVMDFILLNCRLPEERQADLRAQAASAETGLRRLQ
ncbi:MAG: hydantoinase B/oxoprolinase family protein, partial [Acidimicrobiia bacterium]